MPDIPDEQSGLVREARRVRGALDDLAHLARPRRGPQTLSPSPIPRFSVPPSPSQRPATDVSIPNALNSFFDDEPTATPPVQSFPPVTKPVSDADWFADPGDHTAGEDHLGRSQLDIQTPPREQETKSAGPRSMVPPTSMVPNTSPPPPPEGDSINEVLDGFDW